MLEPEEGRVLALLATEPYLIPGFYGSLISPGMTLGAGKIDSTIDRVSWNVLHAADLNMIF